MLTQNSRLETDRVTLLALFLTIFVDAAGVALVYPILTPLFVNNETALFYPSVSFEMRNFLYGFLLALYPMMMFLCSPFFGTLSDKHGRRSILILCLAGNLVGLIMMGVGINMNSIIIIFLARAVSGITAANMPIAQAAIIDISIEETKAKNLSLITAANSVGFVVGPIITGILSRPILGYMPSLSSSFYIAAILPLIPLFLVIFYFKNTSYPNKNLKFNFFSAFHSIYFVFKNASTQMPLLIFASFLTGYYMFFSYLSMFALLAFEYNQLMESILLGYFCFIFGCSFLFFVPYLTKRCSLNRCLLISIAPQFIAILVFILFTNVLILWLTATIMAIFVPCSYVALISILSNKTERESQGRIMGVSMSVNSLAWGLTPLLAVVLQNHSPLLPFIISVLVLLFTLFLVISYVRKATAPA